MSAYSQTLTANVRPVQFWEVAKNNLTWSVAVILSELLFVVCRASVGFAVSLDDPVIWLAGLVPFVLAACSYRLFKTVPTLYLCIWVSALVAIFIFQLFNIAQFIETPLFSFFRVGFIRNFTYSSAYVVLGALFVSSFYMIWTILRKGWSGIAFRLLSLFISVPACSATLALTLFV